MRLSLRSAGREVATAARLLVRRPVFGGLAVALFALSIGSIATIFAVVDATMLRPLPYQHPEELVAATGTEPTGPGTRLDMALGYVQFARWRSDNRVFAAFEGFTPATMKFLGGTSPEPAYRANTLDQPSAGSLAAAQPVTRKTPSPIWMTAFCAAQPSARNRKRERRSTYGRAMVRRSSDPPSPIRTSARVSSYLSSCCTPLRSVRVS